MGIDERTDGTAESREKRDDPSSDSTPADERLPVPKPAVDDLTVQLVRDAVSVARVELSDEEFSRKYGTGPNDSGEEE